MVFGGAKSTGVHEGVSAEGIDPPRQEAVKGASGIFRARFGLLSDWVRRFRAALSSNTPLFIVVVALISGTAGYGVASTGIVDKIGLAAASFGSRVESAANHVPQSSKWSPLSTALEDLEIAEIDVIPNGSPRLAAIEEVGPFMLFTTPLGRFGYIDPSFRIARLDITPPMNLEGLRKSPLYTDPLFSIGEFRINDLLAVRTGPQSYQLYVSHYRFAGDCFEDVISRIDLKIVGQQLESDGSGWREIFVAKPCVPISTSSQRFIGMRGGGRMVMLNADTLLFSVGDFAMDGVTLGKDDDLGPNSDLGKIIAISLATGEARHFASGVRNPQGLTIAKDGRIWETEHGPQGGDEINLIREGVDYGWPHVTLGMDYGAPLRHWPRSATPGRHEGYEAPAYAFLPSVGISNIIEPDDAEFPNWRSHLLVCSLRGRSLFVVGLDGERVVSVEPITLDDRLRDIIALRGGRIAIITDSGRLFLLRRAQKEFSTNFVVAGAASLQPFAREEKRRAAAGFNGLGYEVYLSRCRSCHSLIGRNEIGPALDGVLERQVGSLEGFRYSQSLNPSEGHWNKSLMTAFLLRADPRFDGTAMPPQSLSAQEADAVVEFLANTKTAPPSAD